MDGETFEINGETLSLEELRKHQRAVGRMIARRLEWEESTNEAAAVCHDGLAHCTNEWARLAEHGALGAPEFAFYPIYAVKHGLEALILLRNSVLTFGTYAASLALMRQCLEACNVAAADLLDEPQRTEMYRMWFESQRGDNPQKALRERLQQDVWPKLGWRVPWGADWAGFYHSLQRVMPLLAHYTSRVMQWHQRTLWMPLSRADIGKVPPRGVHFWDPVPIGSVDLERATRLYLPQTLLLWVLGRIGSAIDARREGFSTVHAEAVEELGNAFPSHPDWPKSLTEESLAAVFFPHAGYFVDEQ